MQFGIYHINIVNPEHLFDVNRCFLSYCNANIITIIGITMIMLRILFFVF